MYYYCVFKRASYSCDNWIYYILGGGSKQSYFASDTITTPTVSVVTETQLERKVKWHLAGKLTGKEKHIFNICF